MTDIQRRINGATGVSINPGIMRSTRNSIMRLFAQSTGGRIRGSGDGAYISAS